MNKEKKVSTFQLIVNGYLLVNIPVVIIIIFIAYVGSTNFVLTFREAGIIGVILGWIYWCFSIRIWILSALKKEVSEERLLSIGRSALLLWNKSTIDKAMKKHSNTC